MNNTKYPGTDFPEANSRLVRGSGVSVPELSGSSVSAAQTMLKGLNLVYADGGTQASALPAGQVVASDPVAGTVLAKGATVKVFTSDGSGAAAVPDVTGQSIANAKTAIAAAGFSADKVAVTGFAPGDGKNQCRVAGTDPAPGTSTAKDAAVGLTLFGNVQGADPGSCK